jgi:type II secretory ATPase GspE/PulE/Tfp pilus assembly ATPase PilB-like protein/DNA-binding response OmpR family regulator
MTEEKKPLILAVEDDEDMRMLIGRLLERGGYEVLTAEDGKAALETLKRPVKPDLILTDVMMPGMDGYALCARLQADPSLSLIPVVFVTALSSENDRAAALAAGGVDYLAKPLTKDALMAVVGKNLDRRRQWEKLAEEAIPAKPLSRSDEFLRFLSELAGKLDAPQDLRERLSRGAGGDLYAMAEQLGLTNSQMAKSAAAFLRLEYLPAINPDTIQLGVLPAPFCRSHGVVVVEREPGSRSFVVSNPFQPELFDLLRRYSAEGIPLKPLVTEPENICLLLKRPDREAVEELLRCDAEKVPISDVTSAILESAVYQRASDVHIEPKEGRTVIRFRVDGDMREAFELRHETGLMLISRFKALGEMDVAERRKPQDGAMQAIIDGRSFIVRLATSSTPSGESLVMRLLEPWVKAKTLEELGMTTSQVRHMMEFARRQHGLILVAGPTGSGKTTTIYSLLQHIDCKTRSLLSIEDPVEYRIPDANQQQVDNQSGMTFENLLKSSVRQDPDILFLGEIRDDFSAKMAVDFASTGHLTISSVHTTNATTAIFRLERVGITRGAMADSMLGVIAQKLLKKLCSHCKTSGPISDEEHQMLATFTDDIPLTVCRPAGCPKCGGTGYLGREGVYEIVKFYPEISEMIRRNAPISEIRTFARQRGDYLVSDHALEKVRTGVFSPKDVYEQVLLEEAEYRRSSAAGGAPAAEPLRSSSEAAPNVHRHPESSVHLMPTAPAEEMIGKPLPAAVIPPPAAHSASILVVEDDADTLALMKRVLTNRGYAVTTAGDGVEALLHLGKASFDLIVSDINMPNLDGLKLVELKVLKKIEAPVIFLTAQISPEAEQRGLELGAADYIRKPVSKDVLLLRIERVLAARKSR